VLFRSLHVGGELGLSNRPSPESILASVCFFLRRQRGGLRAEIKENNFLSFIGLFVDRSISPAISATVRVSKIPYDQSRRSLGSKFVIG
jgi:hypothetical protein